MKQNKSNNNKRGEGSEWTEDSEANCPWCPKLLFLSLDINFKVIEVACPTFKKKKKKKKWNGILRAVSNIFVCHCHTSRFLLTGYVGLIWRSTAEATAVVVPLRVRCRYYDNPATVVAAYPKRTLNGTPTCSSSLGGTVSYETYVAGRRNLDVYVWPVAKEKTFLWWVFQWFYK